MFSLIFSHIIHSARDVKNRYHETINLYPDLHKWLPRDLTLGDAGQ